MPQTRRPRGTRIADDVHKALHMRATMTGQTLEDTLDDILRRRLRRELDLLAKVANETLLLDVLEQLDRDGYEIVNDGAADWPIVDYINAIEDDDPEVAAVEEQDGTVYIYELDERGYQKTPAMLIVRRASRGYEAWLGDALMGEGPTEEDAIASAVAEYESAIGYGDEPHLLTDRDALVAALDVGIKEH